MRGVSMRVNITGPLRRRMPLSLYAAAFSKWEFVAWMIPYNHRGQSWLSDWENVNEKQTGLRREEGMRTTLA